MKHLLQAYHILTDYYSDPSFNLKLLANRYLAKEGSQNAANTSRTIYGIIRKQKLLEHIVGIFSRIPPQKIDLPTRILLKIGIFLILYSDGFPDYAVVNEVVSAAPHKSKRFINGILRSLSRQKEKTRAAIANITDPAIRHSIHPDLVHRLGELAGDKMEETLDYLDSEPVFHLKPNLAKIDYPGLRKLLSDKNIPHREIPLFESFEIKHPGKVKDLTAGYTAYFQNTSSQFIALLAAHSAEASVLDCCAAPGSKTVTLKRQKPELRVTAADINIARLRMLLPVIQENRMNNVSLLAMDASRPAIENRFDLVMVDAPCSSVGTIRKNPDLKLKIDESAIRRNAAQQERILNAIIERFPGRLVLYSVCSFTAPESDGVMDAMMRTQAIELLDIDGFLQRYKFAFRRGRYGYYLLPTPSLNNDLFYISLFRTKR